MSGEERLPTEGATTPQCQFFVQRKKRLCRMTVKPGRRYCGEHEPQPTTEAGQVDQRIPCPNDPKHTCYASKLVKHLAICNSRRTEQPPYIVHNINAPEEAESCPRRPLSSVPKEELANIIDKINHLYTKHVEGQITSEPCSHIHRAVLSEFNEEGRAESSRRHLRQVSALLALAEREGLVADRTCYVELGAGKGQLSYYACHAWCGGGGSCVLAVDRAPLRHKRDNKLRSAPPTSTHTHGDPAQTETFGDVDTRGDPAQTEPCNDTDTHGDPAQKGPSGDARTHGDPAKTGLANDTNNIEQSHHIPGNSVTQINKSDTSYSASNSNGISNEILSSAHSNPTKDTINHTIDAKNNAAKISSIKSDQSASNKDQSDAPIGSEVREVDGGEVAVRLRADLAHLALEAVPAVAAATAVVGLAKHLCGVATDYALRCVAAAGVAHKARGAVVATCCHHRVEAQPYVGSLHLQELGITAEELNIMLGVVSWATCGDGRSRERRARDGDAAATHPRHARSQAEREEVGRRAKALVDWGRVLWLRARGFDARLVHYVPADVSPENRAILAVRR